MVCKETVDTILIKCFDFLSYLDSSIDTFLRMLHSHFAQEQDPAETMGRTQLKDGWKTDYKRRVVCSSFKYRQSLSHHQRPPMKTQWLETVLGAITKWIWRKLLLVAKGKYLRRRGFLPHRPLYKVTRLVTLLGKTTLDSNCVVVIAEVNVLPHLVVRVFRPFCV